MLLSFFFFADAKLQQSPVAYGVLKPSPAIIYDKRVVAGPTPDYDKLVARPAADTSYRGMPDGARTQMSVLSSKD